MVKVIQSRIRITQRLTTSAITGIIQANRRPTAAGRVVPLFPARGVGCEPKFSNCEALDARASAVRARARRRSLLITDAGRAVGIEPRSKLDGVPVCVQQPVHD
jgi:hypothetical protein